MLYRKLNIPNFESMRLELETATKNRTILRERYWDEPVSWIETNAVQLYNFINNRKKFPIRLCRFYLTPPRDKLIPHIDGLTHHRSPIGLNIPITGFYNTSMDWYNCPDDNFIDGRFGFNNSLASRVVDFNKLTKCDSTVIDCPTFVRTDVVHGVINPNLTPRLILSIRFYYMNDVGTNFEDVMDLTNL